MVRVELNGNAAELTKSGAATVRYEFESMRKENAIAGHGDRMTHVRPPRK